MNNTAYGSYALYSNTTGAYNTANGASALYSNTTGSYNTANGYGALDVNTTGINNTASGFEALQFNTTGSNNTANGYVALVNNTTGTNNTANGASALWLNTTGSNNTANGYGALDVNTTGSYNTANGSVALGSNTTGSNNTASGYGALTSNTTGTNNTALGYQAGNNNNTGSGDIFIGANAGYNETASNSFYVNNIQEANLANDKAYSLLYGKFSGSVASLTGQQLTINGNVGIGSVAPAGSLDVSPTGTICFGSSCKTSWAGGGTNYWSLAGGTGNVGISTTNTVGIGTTSGIGAGLIVMNGNVGIGTWVPSDMFQVGKYKSSSSGLEIDSNGNVGMGTTITSNAPLSIMNGNVGIGTWVPGANLDLVSPVGADLLLEDASLTIPNYSSIGPETTHTYGIIGNNSIGWGGLVIYGFNSTDPTNNADQPLFLGGAFGNTITNGLAAIAFRDQKLMAVQILQILQIRILWLNFLITLHH